jgi:thiamine-phosphate pyrophosphorylase
MQTRHARRGAARGGDVFRILDANINRFCEGARVIEETFRFLLDDDATSRRFKAVRRRLRNAFRSGDWPERLLSRRDAAADRGAPGSYDKGNIPRARLADLLAANFKRMQESVRVMEEYSRLAAAPGAGLFKSLRFELYDLEKKSLLPLLKAARVASKNPKSKRP